jgi:NADH-quinone oxidoreductase subunit M
MLGLGVVGIVYGALVAMVQPDIKKLVAYSSVSHLGFVIVGLFSFNLLAYQGSMLQMVNHGLSTGGLFFLVGMIYERRHTRLLDEFGGIGSLMPKYATLFLVTTLSSIGLPALNGFIGEWNILLGSFLNQPIVGVLAGTGVILGAWYLLQAVQKVFYGPIRNEANRVLRDLSFREVAVMAPLVALFVWIGLFPAPFLGRLEPSLSRILEEVNVPGVKPYRPAGIVAHNGSREG